MDLNGVKYFRLFLFPILISVLSSCGNSSRLLNFPLDSSGRSLNSRSSDLNPQINSQYVVFVSDRNGSLDVYLFDLRNKRTVDLPGLNSFDEITSHPSISRDGRYLVFAASRQGKSGIYLYDRDNQQKRFLSGDIEGEVRNPSISANGASVVFEVANKGQWDIVIYDLKGNPINSGLDLF